MSARDVQRTFETWLALAKDVEVLTLADLVLRALRGRGYLCQITFTRPARAMTEHQEDSQENSGERSA